MSNKGNKYKVGLLTIISVILLLVVLVSLGILSTFKTHYKFITIVHSSVQGLEKGAKVKYKGVMIGKVTDIKINADGGDIIIYMEMDPKAIESQISKAAKEKKFGDDKQELFKKFLTAKVEKGLRCQLRYGGITGDLYIEIGIYDPEKYPLKDYKFPNENYAYLPSVPPVLIENIMGTFQEALEKIASIDVNKIVADIDRTINNANNTLNEIDKGIKDAKIAKLSDSMKDFLDTSRQTMKEVSELRKSVDVSLQNANDLMGSAKNLIEYFEEHPSAVIYGRQDKPVMTP